MAVQAPQGDIFYLLSFFRNYVGQHLPEHLIEHFCGTAFLAATWCRADVRRSAVGLDIDADALEYGWEHHYGAELSGAGGGIARLCLLHGSVLENLATAQPLPQLPQLSDHDGLRSRPGDIVCAFNFSIGVLHTRSILLQYLRHARRAVCNMGGIFVADLLGGHAAEQNATILRRSSVTGAQFVWEQQAFDVITRRIVCYISLCDEHSGRWLPRAFRYDWRLWTIPELQEALYEAGFQDVHVWIRPMADTFSQKDGEPAEEEANDADFVEYQPGAMDANTKQAWSCGWTAYVIGVVMPSEEA